MNIICKHCKYSNDISASYCVKCGRLLDGANVKVVIPQDTYDSLKRQNKSMEDRVRSLEQLDALRLEKIQGLQKDLDSCRKKEQDSYYYLVLVSAGAAKLQVVKAVKESLNLELTQAKSYVDNAPSVICVNLSKYNSDIIARSIVAAGGEVEIKRHDDIPSGHTVIKKSYYDFLQTERDKVLKEGYAPPGYHLEEDKIKKYQSPYDHIKDLIRSTDPELTIRTSEYENLKRRANMSLWDKIKETLGFN